MVMVWMNQHIIYSISFWIFLHSNNTEYKSGDNEYKKYIKL